METYLSTLGDTGSCRYWLHPHIILHSYTCGLDSHPHFSHSCAPQTLGKGRNVLWSTERGSHTNWEFIKHSVVLVLDSKYFLLLTLSQIFPHKRKHGVKCAVKKFKRCRHVYIFLWLFPHCASNGCDFWLLQRSAPLSMFACFIISHSFNDFLSGRRHFLSVPQWEPEGS